MSKYTPEQLQAWAREAIAARAAQDPRYMQLVLALMLRLGLDPMTIDAEIERLAA